MLSSSPKITRVQQSGVRHYKVEGHEELFPVEAIVRSEMLAAR